GANDFGGGRVVDRCGDCGGGDIRHGMNFLIGLGKGWRAIK
ncbi:MAG: hypothetical protein ACI9TZ_002747, partial [Yoonia sp.]